MTNSSDRANRAIDAHGEKVYWGLLAVAVVTILRDLLENRAKKRRS